MLYSIYHMTFKKIEIAFLVRKCQDFGKYTPDVSMLVISHYVTKLCNPVVVYQF